LRRIERRTRAAAPAPPRRAGTLEELVGGAVEETERGPLLVARRRYSIGHAHGRHRLTPAAGPAPPALAMLGRAETSPDGRRLAYLDTETTGLAGGTGTYAFLVGVGFVDGDEFEVCQLFMRDPEGEAALPAPLEALPARFDGLVTYNGTGFDLPLLETRFVLGRRRWPADRFPLALLTSPR